MRGVREAMSLAEVLIALAIIAVLAAIMIPQVTGKLRTGQSAALAQQLTNLREAISNYHDNVNAYPTTLTQLTTPPVVGDQDLCSVNLSPAERNAWRGPYLAQTVLATGIPVGDVIVQNDVVRNPLTDAATPPGILQIYVSSVPITIAADLDKQFDGDSVYTTGSILWDGGSETLIFQVPIRGC
jgi:prepilin-type N-terminal cleavage/methylation domain-containing protein